MANKGQKISQLVYSTLGDAVNDGAQVPVSVDIGGTKANRRVPIQEIKGYQGNQGNQGRQGNQGNQGYQGNQGNQGPSIGYTVEYRTYSSENTYEANTIYFEY